MYDNAPTEVHHTRIEIEPIHGCTPQTARGMCSNTTERMNEEPIRLSDPGKGLGMAGGEKLSSLEQELGLWSVVHQAGAE